MILTNPIYLAALAGLAIPIAIHLLSRKEGKVIKLGSIRHIVETNTQQFKGIRLNEILLLFLRCALIVLLCFLLSGLKCTSKPKEKWLVVEKGLDLKPFGLFIDSLNKEGYENHLLANGFPLLKDSDNFFSKINYWKLADELNEKNLLQVVVLAMNRIQGFDGKKTALAQNIRWISQELPPKKFQLAAIKKSNDTVIVRTGHSNANATYFDNTNTTDPFVSERPLVQETLNIALVADTVFWYDKRIILASLKAIEKSIPVKIKIHELTSLKTPTDSVDWCISLTSDPFDKIKSKNFIFLNIQQSDEILAQQFVHRWMLTKRLNEETALDENFTLKLALLLLPGKSLGQIATLSDRRMLPDSLAWSTSSALKTQATVYAPADPYLLLAFLILLLAERALAYHRKQ
ncbi:MAG: BatA domain-containing protein [Bacteroidetes bacterium]|nr:BatA domain-containing protein [Bacteroidota bacterium]